MSHYIDAIVIPVPRANLDTYKRMSAEWGSAHMRHGALYYSDSISDDAQPGKVNAERLMAERNHFLQAQMADIDGDCHDAEEAHERPRVD